MQSILLPMGEAIKQEVKEVSIVTTRSDVLDIFKAYSTLMLIEPRFKYLNDQELTAVFDNDADVTKITKIIDIINNNTVVA